LQDLWRRGVYLRDLDLDGISLVDGHPVFEDLGWAISDSGAGSSTWDADALRARGLLLLGRAFAGLAGVEGSPLGSVVAIMTGESEVAEVPEPDDLVLLLRGVMLLSGAANAPGAGEQAAETGAVRIAASLLDRMARLERRLARREGKVTSLESELWTADRDLSIHELCALVPRGDSFILVDEGTWGDWPLGGPRALPFPEHEGVFAGFPPDGGTALRELLRLHASGATHIAFPRGSSWWLEQYPELREFLLARARVVLENARLILYRLPPSA
jgi:hypothetical protein